MSTVKPGRAEPSQDGFSVGYYVLALVDVLNQRNALAKWQRLPDGDQLDEPFRQALKKSVGTVIGIRETLTKYVEGYAGTELDPTLRAQLTPEQLHDFMKLSHSELRSQSFSDTCILYSPMRQHAGQPVLKDVFGVLAGMAMLVPGLLSGYVVVRGAIEIGTGTNALAEQIYGPCLASAYQLEQEVADYPRIVIGPNLRAFVREIARRTPVGPFAQLAVETAKEAERLITIDDDGVTILDHLGEFMAQHDQAMGSVLRPLVQRACGFVSAEYKRFRREGDQKLAARYARLQRYFDSRIRYWST